MLFEHFSRDINNSAFQPEKFEPIKNFGAFYPNKPMPGTGLWACPVDCSRNWKQQQDFEDSISNDDLPLDSKWVGGFKFKLTDTSRLAIVEDPMDAKELPLRASDSMEYCIDWEKTAEQHDALIVQKDALQQSGPFWGWDVESLVVLNPNVVQNVKHAASTAQN